MQNIEMDLGYKFTDLEISHEEIVSLIRMRTLPEYSKYFPYEERIIINVNTDKVPGYVNRFFLKSKNEIININRIIGNSNNGISDYIEGTPNPVMNYGGSNMIARQTYADLASVANPTTYEYFHPNMIEFTPSYNNVGTFIIAANVVHPEHLGTIPTNMQEHFIRLALLDVKSSLYLMRSRFANLQTTFGNLELFIDDLSSARDERNELIERMKLSSFKSAHRKKLWIG